MALHRQGDAEVGGDGTTDFIGCGIDVAGDFAYGNGIGVAVVGRDVNPIIRNDVRLGRRPVPPLGAKAAISLTLSIFTADRGSRFHIAGMIGNRDPNCMTRIIITAHPIVAVIDDRRGPYGVVGDRIAVTISVSQGYLFTFL